MDEYLRDQTCCFTGHGSIPAKEIGKVRRGLKKQIRRLIKKGYRYFLCGGSLGFDTLAAITVLDLKKRYKGIFLIMVIGYRGQTENWDDEDILLFNDILDQADSVKILSKVYYNGVMLVRDRYMVDNSTACIAYLRKTTGSTAHTVEYTQNGEYGRKIECILV